MKKKLPSTKDLVKLRKLLQDNTVVIKTKRPTAVYETEAMPESKRTPAQQRKYEAKQLVKYKKEEADRKTAKLLDMIGMGAKKVLKVRNYTAGYMVVTYLMGKEEHGATRDWEHEVAFSIDGVYLGLKKDAHYLMVKRGIIPMKRDFMRMNASIGFSPKEGKWYGWSHRAIFGFKPGMVGKKGHIGIKPGHRLKNWVEARQAAERFAQEVS